MVDAPRQLDEFGLLPKGVSASRAYEHILSVGWHKILSDQRERIELQAYAAALAGDADHDAEVLAMQESARKAGIL